MVDKSEKVAWLARLGFVTRGIVYILLGYLALTTARKADVDDGAGDAFAVIGSVPGGSLALYLAAAGLVGYALYRLSCALFDIERKGSDAKGMAHRTGYFASALVHLGMAWTAARIAMGARKSGEDQSSEMAESVLDFTLGSTVLGMLGLALIVAGMLQAKNAWTASFMRNVSHRAPKATCPIGRAGHAARAVVFALIGWSLLRSAWFERSSEVLSLGGAINDLRDMGWAFTLVAAGLLLFGVFSVILARYRIIPDPAPASLPTMPWRR
ncbi:DUF1206 domain-containing protein [Novosphingobium sp. MMS21-SN21R]|uniref:DUF1206 domain-containing protein n=1 Tax=Novosphingobium sp. MMS21-SN21R TaxID=2969298 RepID=UPI002887ABEF|nr:DUF1206 domain-containing protein [Novosphingobium sp. MMS21-SN21R]MDT0507867.1 DUF1206 domain-containing protein [Novosphingobium sp. MMS21-SN21R]